MSLETFFQVTEDDIVRPEAQASAGEEWRLLRKIHLPETVHEATGDETRNAIIIDVETTGTQPADEVIQLAMLPFQFERNTGRILTIHRDREFCKFREPKRAKISKESTQIHGITPDQVKGHSIAAEEFAELLDEFDLLIAHNADFDRRMVEKHWPRFKRTRWACTLRGIPWFGLGFGKSGLEHLATEHGFFYDRHHAMGDCQALLVLLAQDIPSRRSGADSETDENESDRPKIMSLLEKSAQAKLYLLRLHNVAFDDNAVPRGLRFRWDRDRTCWYRTTSDPEATIAEVREKLGNRFQPSYQTVDPNDWFTDRVTQA